MKVTNEQNLKFIILLKKIAIISIIKTNSDLNYGGQGWIRTIEDEVDGFTVRCIWPLCNLPIKFKHHNGAFWSW